MIENQIKVETLASLQENQPRTHNWGQKSLKKWVIQNVLYVGNLRKVGIKIVKKLVTPQATNSAIQQQLERLQQLLTSFPSEMLTSWYWLMKRISCFKSSAIDKITGSASKGKRPRFLWLTCISNKTISN